MTTSQYYSLIRSLWHRFNECYNRSPGLGSLRALTEPLGLLIVGIWGIFELRVGIRDRGFGFWV